MKQNIHNKPTHKYAKNVKIRENYFEIMKMRGSKNCKEKLIRISTDKTNSPLKNENGNKNSARNDSYKQK